MILARLAVDRNYQRRRLGEGLLKDALQRVTHASTIVGARCLLVHPIDREAEAFYDGYGFKPLPGEQKTLFLPIDTITRAL
jgi:GNAT superfamily N-acetyltransferase